MRGMGGVAVGSRHSEGGIAMIDRVSGQELGEFEGGEPILTRGVAQNPYLLAAASRINVLGGGRAFAEAGGITPGGSSQSFNLDLSLIHI